MIKPHMVHVLTMQGLLEPLDGNHVLGDFESLSLRLDGKLTKTRQ